MKKIIGNMIYDTDNAEKVYSFRQKRKVCSLGGFNFYECYDVDAYKTKKIIISYMVI